MSISGGSPPRDGRRILVHNPVSGDGTHTGLVHAMAEDHGFEVWDTESGEDIVEKAAEASAEADVVAAAGGDGTLTRAIRGLARADAFDDTIFAAVPAGTGNNFAGNAGIRDIPHSFEVVESGDLRRIDLGRIDGTPFLNSCVAGLTAEASVETDPEEKERWGALAYVMATARTVTEFEPIRVAIEPADDDAWTCDADLVIVGNARRFPRASGSQANVEDGLLDVTVVEDARAVSLVSESIRHVLGNEAEHVSEFKTPRVHLELDGSSNRISVDGELVEAADLTASVRARTLWIPVGEGYDPDPPA